MIRGAALDESLRAIDELAGDEKIVVAILIYPDDRAGWNGFDAFASELRRVDTARWSGGALPFAMAPFHPEARFGTETPSRLVMFFRRAPDPCIQLVRFRALDAVRSAAPSGKFLFDGSLAAMRELERRARSVPVSDQIASDNFAAFAQAGRDRFEAIFADIRADRARAYAAFESVTKSG